MGVLRLMQKALLPAAVTALLAVSVIGCGTQRRVRQLQEGGVSTAIRLPKESESRLPETAAPRVHRDTLTVDDGQGGEIYIMKAIRDEDGEMVANEVLDAAMVTARFRNVAERHGKVDLEFQIVVPESMMASHWQLRLTPDMYILGDSVRLDGVTITGREYRRAQLRGYQQYERFLSTIITDTTKFINISQLEIFLRRNIPQLYTMKTDSSYVSDEVFESIYGATEQEAVEHYTSRFAIHRNERRKARRGKMYARYVKAPIVTEGLRLDTVMQAVNGDFIYSYIQTVETRPQLRKVDIVLSGGVYEEDRKVYTVPPAQPLTFYISSISTLTDNTERYLSKVLERRADASTACWIEFRSGSSDVDLTLGGNASETGRITQNLASLLRNETYDLDSIVVSANASPEGNWKYNERLSQKRSEGVSRFFRSWMKDYADSLEREQGVFIGLDGEAAVQSEKIDISRIAFIPHSTPENWDRLDAMVERDSMLTFRDKKSYWEIREISDPDARERALQKEPYYRYLREKVYPYLRTVKFDFHLHRKDMIKDTVHTTELDTAYMRGVQLIRDRDYRKALEILRPYQDYNTAVAYTLMDYNASALAILSRLDRTPQVDYLLAILFSRQGDDQRAVGSYLSAVRKDESYKHRGNLDPEISQLIKAYGLNREEEEDLEY